MAPDARLIWSAKFDPSVLTVAVCRSFAPARECFDLTRLGARALVTHNAENEYVAINDGGVSLRLDVVSGSVCGGPVMIEHRLAGISALAPKIPALYHFISLCRSGKMATWREPADPRLPRLILALRVLDAVHDGASQRDIGTMLLGGGNRIDWPGPGDSNRSYVRRLIALARRMEDLGPRGILSRKI